MIKAQNDFVNIHSHYLSDKGIVIQNLHTFFELANDSGFVSVGIHPWNIKETNVEEALKIISKTASNKNVLAIGECGLDKLITIDLNKQEEIFKAQIKIAELVQKPIIVHCVKAFDNLIRIKKEMNVSVPMIIHGFNNNKQIAELLLKNDLYFSFGKALLNSESNASKIISSIPIEKIFFETDSEHLSIKTIFDAAATLLKMNVENLKEKININFNNVFYCIQ